MAENLRKKDMRGTVNRHIKAEWMGITSISRGEAIEILYDDAEMAAKKANTIKRKSYGTDCPVAVTERGCSVLVVRL